MEVTSKPITNPVVVLREEFDDWAVLYNPDTAGAVGINPVGIAAWRLMNGQRTLAEILERVKEDFSDVPETAFDELSAFVDDLINKGFVSYAAIGEN
jgi:SynChlorMet cassette protein ScmD